SHVLSLAITTERWTPSRCSTAVRNPSGMPPEVHTRKASGGWGAVVGTAGGSADDPGSGRFAHPWIASVSVAPRAKPIAMPAAIPAVRRRLIRLLIRLLTRLAPPPLI